MHKYNKTGIPVSFGKAATEQQSSNARAATAALVLSALYAYDVKSTAVP